MKKENVKLFKQFLVHRGLDTLFRGLYRQYRFDKNPEDFDQYLEQVDSYFVIEEAFDFNKIKASSSFDGGYWAQLSKRWRKYMKKQAEHGYYRDEVIIPRRPVMNADGSVHVSPTAPPPHMPEPERPEPEIEHDWSGMNLIPLKATGKRQMDPPSAHQIRVCTTSGNTVVLSTYLSSPLVENGLLTMEMQVDRDTNRMVFVFGTSSQYAVHQYSSNLYSVAHKSIIEYLQKYLKTKFDPKKVYYISTGDTIWNKDKTKCAVVITNKVIEKER